MTVKTGQAWAGLFVCLDATGALEAGTPSGVLYVDGVADGATVTITGSNPYKWSVTLPSLTAGQRVDMYITATISTIATAGIVASEQADTALVSEVKAETASILEDTGTDGVVLKAAGLAEDAVNKIVDQVWNEAIADHTTATTFGGKNQKVVPSETIGDYKADVSGLATTTHLQEVEDKVDTVDGNVDAILLDTGTDGVKIASGELSDLALEATLTAMKGAGWTDETLKAIKDAVDAISAGSGASVDQIWNELTATHTTVGSFAKAITDILQDTGTDIPALITALGAWQATNVTTAVSSGSITDIRGSSWSIPITDLTLDTNKQQFVIKRNVQDADTAALLFVDSATGLIYINGAAGTAGDATLVYAGTTLTLTVKPGATAQLPVGTFHYGIQSVTAAGAVEEPYGGIFTISGDYVRAIT